MLKQAVLSMCRDRSFRISMSSTVSLFCLNKLLVGDERSIIPDRSESGGMFDHLFAFVDCNCWKVPGDLSLTTLCESREFDLWFNGSSGPALLRV